MGRRTVGETTRHSVPGYYESSLWDADFRILKVIGSKPGVAKLPRGATRRICYANGVAEERCDKVKDKLPGRNLFEVDGVGTPVRGSASRVGATPGFDSKSLWDTGTCRWQDCGGIGPLMRLQFTSIEIGQLDATDASARLRGRSSCRRAGESVV